ncbi:hypothetical protein [Halobaculum lipolyticum]|uniref:Uncharacterized protein n=1 Tax=Halobaculum lipolyticum TaxID=3032001 RepID=A0ABD5W4L0_9EURY|nr:hypothetical protein [Halobaculum sp. DT31]
MSSVAPAALAAVSVQPAVGSLPFGAAPALQSLVQIESTPGEPPYAALLFVATFVSLFGVLLTLHGAAAYALLVWEWAAGAAAWVYLHPAVGAFFFLAAVFQAPLAAHLWGDPLSLRPRVWRAVQSTAAALDEREKR